MSATAFRTDVHSKPESQVQLSLEQIQNALRAQQNLVDETEQRHPHNRGHIHAANLRAHSLCLHAVRHNSGYDWHELHSIVDPHLAGAYSKQRSPRRPCQAYSSHDGSVGRQLQRTGGIKRRVGPSTGSVGATDNAQGSFLPSICARA